MKKLIFLVAALTVMAFLFTACGNTTDAPVDTDNTEVSGEVADDAADEEATDDKKEDTGMNPDFVPLPEFTPEPDLPTGPFEKDAAQTLLDITIGWNLGNAFDSFIINNGKVETGLQTETSWGNPETTKEMIDDIKAAGFDTVRVPVTWYNHMDANNKIDEAWMDRVNEVIDYVIDNDMYCIINVHHDTGTDGWLRASRTNEVAMKAKFQAIWEQISARYADYGDKLLFEGFNEILDDKSNWSTPNADSLAVVNELNQLFVDTVRASGGNNDKRILICNTYAAGASNTMISGFKLPTDTIENRIIVEAHVYQPFYFTHENYPDTVNWSQGQVTPQLRALYNSFVMNNIPVLIGEFGTADKDNNIARVSYAKFYVDYCTQYGMRCIWWDNGTQYKVYNRKTLEVSNPQMIDAMVTEARGGNYVVDTTLHGDTNDNGELDEEDIAVLADFLAGKGAEPNSDMNYDGKIDQVDLDQLTKLVEAKYNLCANTDKWTSYFNAGGNGKGKFGFLADGVELTVENPGTNAWDGQMTYDGLVMEQGQSYKLSFDYMATKPLTQSVNVLQRYGSYSSYYGFSLNYSTELQHYEAYFTMDKPTDDRTGICFDGGVCGVAAPYTITIKNLYLAKVDEIPADANGGAAPAAPAQEGNLASVASNLSAWAQPGDAEMTASNSANGIAVTVNKAGSQDWHVQTSYKEITLEQGATYTIEFDYSATADVSLPVLCQMNYDPYEPYFNDTINANSTTQHYKGTFKMSKATDSHVMFVINCGKQNAPYTFNLSNLVIKKAN